MVDYSCFISEQRQIVILLLERSSKYAVILKLSIDGDLLLLKGWGPSQLRFLIEDYTFSEIAGDSAGNIFTAMFSDRTSST